MQINYEDVSFVLEHYKLEVLNDEETRNQIINGILEIYSERKNRFVMSNELIILFNDFYYQLDKKTARKIVSDILGQQELAEFFDELCSCNELKDKLSFDRENYLITLKVHDGFIVKSDLALQETYINDKFYYNIEEQDLLWCYCDFVNDKCICVQFKKRRLLSFFGLCSKYFKFSRNDNKIEKFKNNKNVEMIFTNKEVIYKSGQGRND